MTGLFETLPVHASGFLQSEGWSSDRAGKKQSGFSVFLSRYLPEMGNGRLIFLGLKLEALKSLTC